jgi:isopentenyldiphosphate isomerase
MDTELLNFVDEQDQVVGCCSRREIHENGLKHRAVHILVFNNLNQLFLQKRSMKKDLHKGLWDSSAAGHVDINESYSECASRELKEELGVKAEVAFLFKLPAIQELGMEFIQVYRCRHNGPFILSADEIEYGAWQKIEIISERVNADDPHLTQTFKIIWRQFIENHS